MEDNFSQNLEISENIDIFDILKEIKNLTNPDKLILFHRKVGSSKKTLSFKICIILNIKNKLEIEKNIYKNIDSDIPFDVIIYTQEEWETLKSKKHSFVNKILKTGILIDGSQEQTHQ
ncbi:MAG: hypothetical protein J6C55_00605 [Oscillospiraceae bacterium]|nr:hypothetical protein [Oscillospiraceae bacterium]